MLPVEHRDQGNRESPTFSLPGTVFQHVRDVKPIMRSQEKGGLGGASGHGVSDAVLEVVLEGGGGWHAGLCIFVHQVYTCVCNVSSFYFVSM